MLIAICSERQNCYMPIAFRHSTGTAFLATRRHRALMYSLDTDVVHIEVTKPAIPVARPSKWFLPRVFR
jgi:hypothetical protein